MRKKRQKAVVSGISDPDRFSIFPDGKRILVGFNNNYRSEKERGQMGIVDVEKKTIAPTFSQNLKDPDHPEFFASCSKSSCIKSRRKKTGFQCARLVRKRGRCRLFVHLHL